MRRAYSTEFGSFLNLENKRKKDMGTSRTKRLIAKKAGKKKVVLPKSLNHPTLTLVVEFDEDHDLSGLMDTIQELLDLARGDGEVISADLTNVPATLDCTKLDRRY
jgi:hypothetical protein